MKLKVQKEPILLVGTFHNYEAGKLHNKQVPTSKLFQTFLTPTTRQAGISHKEATLTTASLTCPRTLPGSEAQKTPHQPSRAQHSNQGACALQEELPGPLQPHPCTGSGFSVSGKNHSRKHLQQYRLLHPAPQNTQEFICLFVCLFIQIFFFGPPELSAMTLLSIKELSDSLAMLSAVSQFTF